MNLAGTPLAVDVPGFPTVRLAAGMDRMPVEVSLIAELGIGAGSRLVRQVAARLPGHPGFVDALDEPSARLAGIDLGRGERSSLYTFLVGDRSHPFHRHAGHRVFTAVSGSGGAQLRFSAMALDQARRDPDAFIESIDVVNIPPDCLFTVRFGGGTWHQFAPGDASAGQPAFVALSCHTDELGGLPTGALLEKVCDNRANIAVLTELLPEDVQARVLAAAGRVGHGRTVWLSLTAPGSGFWAPVRRRFRALVGGWRERLGSGRLAVGGAVAWPLPLLKVEALRCPGIHTLMERHFKPRRISHDDAFVCRVADAALQGTGAVGLLDLLLQALAERPPAAVTGLMLVRNALVMPLGLRRSRLGCPVSSLAGPAGDNELFQGRHRVLAQHVDPDGRSAQVLLGADDRHLRFRTTIGVRMLEAGIFEFSLANRVECLGAFGRFYIRAIRPIHHRYVVPALMRAAVGHALMALRRDPAFAVVPVPA